MHKISISSNSKYLACASIDEKAIKNMRNIIWKGISKTAKLKATASTIQSNNT
jgi:hypothetical protein